MANLSAKHIRFFLKNSLQLKPEETLVIATDDMLSDLGTQFWEIARRTNKELLHIIFNHKSNQGNYLPESIISALTQCNAAVILTRKALAQSCFDRARQNGSRLIVMQNTTPRLVERSVMTNYQTISNLSRKLADLFSIGRKLQLTTPSGTQAVITIQRVKGISETGVAQHPGEFSFLPAGEACVMLNGNYLHGKLIIDRIVGNRKKLQQPVILNCNKGQITQIKGKTEAQLLRKELRKFGAKGRKVYEFGIGTNNKVMFGNSPQEDEKVLGNVHISIGQSHTTKTQGKLIEATKAILLKPTITIDSKVIIDKGKILV